MNENEHNIEPQPKRRGRPPKSISPARLSDLAPLPQESPSPSQANAAIQNTVAVPLPESSEAFAGQVDLREAPRREISKPTPVKVPEVIGIVPEEKLPEPIIPRGLSRFPILLLLGDVVQVSNNNSKDFGLLFTVGDIRDGKVHGFRLNLGQIEYVTVPEGDCVAIGPSKVRSRRPCSPKWTTDNQ